MVEAALRSGSLVTARCALEQGVKFCFARSNRESGKRRASLVNKTRCDSCDGTGRNSGKLAIWIALVARRPENSFYSPDQEDVALPFPELLANVGDEVTPVDVVAERAGQPVPEVVTQLLELELAGWIAAVPGGYVRLRRACHVRRTNVFV